jgi:hypothetical protein
MLLPRVKMLPQSTQLTRLDRSIPMQQNQLSCKNPNFLHVVLILELEFLANQFQFAKGMVEVLTHMQQVRIADLQVLVACLLVNIFLQIISKIMMELAS